MPTVHAWELNLDRSKASVKRWITAFKYALEQGSNQENSAAFASYYTERMKQNCTESASRRKQDPRWAQERLVSSMRTIYLQSLNSNFRHSRGKNGEGHRLLTQRMLVHLAAQTGELDWRPEHSIPEDSYH